MLIREFDEIAREHFDISNPNTLKCLTTINEADQIQTMDGLTVALYKKIQKNALAINFEQIPESRGDITKVEGYEEMTECVNIIKNLLIEYRQDLEPTDSILQCIANIRERTQDWETGYQLKIEPTILLYQTMVLAVYGATSLLIDSCVEYIKDAGSDTYAIKLNKVSYMKSKNALLLRNVRTFNKGCDNGDIDKALELLVQSKSKNFTGTGSVLLAVAGIAALTKIIIPVLRELIYYFFHTKQQISDYFIIQANLIDMNAVALEGNPYSRLSDKEKKEAVAKQRKIADTFRKIGNKFQIQSRTGEKAAMTAISSDTQKYKVSDVVNGKLDSYTPDSDEDSLF